MTSVRRLADEIESLIDAREEVLYEKLDASTADNGVFRARLKRSREDTDRLNDENEEIGRELAALESQLATTTRSCNEKLLAARMRANWQWQKNATAGEARNKELADVKAQLETYATAAAARDRELATARAQLETCATTAAARDRELADVKAHLAKTRMRLRDKLELDALAHRGDLEAAAERLRRSTRDPAADLIEFGIGGLAAREDDNEDMVEDL